MKLKTICSGTILALALTGGGLAPGQSQTPGPTDYSGFGRFIANRNIFDPQRYPHPTGTRIRRRDNTPRHRAAPAFAFVGAMEYGKGLFAFFDGNNDDYRKSLQVNGKIAGYTVAQITLTGVKLVSGTNTVALLVGNQMRQASDGLWDKTEENADFSDRTEGSARATATSSSSSSVAAPAAPVGEMSDVLKRLKMLREQENK